jgi:hypothetical protein
MRLITKSMTFTDRDFLRIDKKDYHSSSFLQKKINEISKMNLLVSLFWRLIISPCYFIYSRSVPRIVLNGVSKDIRKLRFGNNISPFCFRIRFSFIFYSLARVIVLDDMRISKKGQMFLTLRNELNKAEKLGYSTEIFQGEMAIALLDRFCLTGVVRNWREVSNFRIGKHDCELFVCVGFNSDKEVIGVNTTLVSKSYAYNIFYS